MHAWKYGKLPHRKLERLERMDAYLASGDRTVWDEQRKNGVWELLMNADAKRFFIARGTTDTQLDGYVKQLQPPAQSAKNK
jgi:hypothetical protein